MTTCRPRRLVWPPLKVVLKRPCSCATALNSGARPPGPLPLMVMRTIVNVCGSPAISAFWAPWLGLYFRVHWTLRWNRTLFIRRFKLPRLPPKSSYLAFTYSRADLLLHTTVQYTILMSPTPHSKLVRRHTEAAQLEILRRCPWHGAPAPLLGANLGLFPVSAESENWYCTAAFMSHYLTTHYFTSVYPPYASAPRVPPWAEYRLCRHTNNQRRAPYAFGSTRFPPLADLLARTPVVHQPHLR